MTENVVERILDRTGYKNIRIGWSDIASIMFFCGMYGKVYRYEYEPKDGYSWADAHSNGFNPEDFTRKDIEVARDYPDEPTIGYDTARDVISFGENGEYSAIVVAVPDKIPQRYRKIFKIEKCVFLHFFNDEDYEIGIELSGSEDVEIYQALGNEKMLVIRIPDAGGLENIRISDWNPYDWVDEELRGPKPKEEVLQILEKRGKKEPRASD